MNHSNKTVCVVGASGLLGSNILKEALARGYKVNGTLRDVIAPGKATFLNALPNAETNLRLFEAEMADKASLDDAFSNVDCVFIACLIPVYKGPTGKPAREMDDEQGYAEIIMPTVNGCLNIMNDAAKHRVKNVVICSSTSITNPLPPVPIKN